MRTRYRPHPQSAPGDFYVVNGECLSCGAPHAVAPDLIGWADDSHGLWKKQPESQAEIDRAIAVLEISEVACHRYAGQDKTILQRLPAELCDFDDRPSRPSDTSPADPTTPRFALLDEDLGVAVWLHYFVERLLQLARRRIRD